MKRRMPIILGTAIGVLIIGVFARAAVTPSARGAGTTSAPSDGPTAPQLQMDNSISGEKASDTETAISSMPFAAFDPAGLGSPRTVYKTDSAIEFDYDTQWGPVVVEELVPSEPVGTWDDQIKGSIALNGQSYTHGTASEVTIRKGQNALLLVAEDESSSTIEWYETDNMELYMYGTGLSSDQLVKLANGI
jgi:hypothetical protein